MGSCLTCNSLQDPPDFSISKPRLLCLHAKAFLVQNSSKLWVSRPPRNFFELSLWQSPHFLLLIPYYTLSQLTHIPKKLAPRTQNGGKEVTVACPPTVHGFLAKQMSGSHIPRPGYFKKPSSTHEEGCWDHVTCFGTAGVTWAVPMWQLWTGYCSQRAGKGLSAERATSHSSKDHIAVGTDLCAGA